MARPIFQIILLSMTIIENSIISCSPHDSFMKLDMINNVPFFYYGNINKILLENDLNIILNNFNETSFDFIKYLKFDNTRFEYNSPFNHPNLIIEFQSYLQHHYYSFSFTHDLVNSDYYECLSDEDLNGDKRDQF